VTEVAKRSAIAWEWRRGTMAQGGGARLWWLRRLAQKREERGGGALDSLNRSMERKERERKGQHDTQLREGGGGLVGRCRGTSSVGRDACAARCCAYVGVGPASGPASLGPARLNSTGSLLNQIFKLPRI
jgi:hypothetical protein